MMDWKIVVERTGRTWSVFGTTRQGAHDLLEGGFFSKARAEQCRDRWERECLQNEVEKAERRAGWDPNP